MTDTHSASIAAPATLIARLRMALRTLRTRSQRGRLRAQAGVTLIEIMIVVAIMALIIAGAAYGFKFFNDAKIEKAKEQVKLIHSKVLLKIQDDDGCPDINSLGLGSKDVKDPWGHNYIVSCPEEGDPLVKSAGPDGSEGNGDDIVSNK